MSDQPKQPASDTPRTDAQTFYRDGSLQYVQSDFARSLERELNEAIKCAETLESALLGCVQRLRLYLALANGEAMEHTEHLPSALENLHAVTAALQSFRVLKGETPQ